MAAVTRSATCLPSLLPMAETCLSINFPSSAKRAEANLVPPRSMPITAMMNLRKVWNECKKNLRGKPPGLMNGPSIYQDTFETPEVQTLKIFFQFKIDRLLMKLNKSLQAPKPVKYFFSFQKCWSVRDQSMIGTVFPFFYCFT